MIPIVVPAVLLLLVCAALAFERTRLGRWRRTIPLRVAVTGTRGKSTVTRLVAAALRESGLRVVAKTTGSKPVLILPDGSERAIRRSGLPSILEQKRVLGRAAALGANALVAEMMGVRAETLGAESRRILQPRILGITNVRLDHLDDMGRTRAAIAAALSAAVPADAVVLVPSSDDDPAFGAASAARRSTLKCVPETGPKDIPLGLGFPENVRLALAMAAEAGVDRETALRGMASAVPDFGSLKIWRMGAAGAGFFCLSLFAANEPESTWTALAAGLALLPARPASLIGLLNLRADRGDRTRQWLDALAAGFFREFARLVFIGDHARALGRRKRWTRMSSPAVGAVASRRPEVIMAALRPHLTAGAAVVGLGNMGGPGEELVELWSRIGEES